jgi:Raf kinase inhibitor-like YbhB/YbcL family protein
MGRTVFQQLSILIIYLSENFIMISKKNISGAVVTVYALFIMLIIIMMSQKTVVYIATRADTYLEKQAYWNAQSGGSIASLHDTRAGPKILDSDDGWDIGQIEVPILGGEPVGRTGRRGDLLDIIKAIDSPQTMILTSDSFTHNGAIPAEFSCTAQNNSPQLTIADVPGNTTSLVLIMDDRDAGVAHWLVWKIPNSTTEFLLNSLPVGTREGANYAGSSQYEGPCPPPGETHRYDFTLYAMDNEINLSAGSTMLELETAMIGHILAQTTLTGTFAR